MHRPRSPRIAAALKAGAWLLLFASLIIIISGAALLYAFVSNAGALFLPALSGLIGSILLLIVFRIVSSSARCSLCASPVLLGSRCQRNKNASPLLGSYRFRVARDIAFTGTFCCPYCGEETLCLPKVRVRQP